jgi:hypothetical protein
MTSDPADVIDALKSLSPGEWAKCRDPEAHKMRGLQDDTALACAESSDSLQKPRGKHCRITARN